MRYRHTTRAEMVREFQKVRDNPEPKAVFFTCMDSRMIPTRFTWVQGHSNCDCDTENLNYKANLRVGSTPSKLYNLELFRFFCSDTHVGDMFVIRNAGNLVPHSQFFQDEHYSCEPAGLELGCVVNDIRHIIVCGHSDCKAMNLLYQLQDAEFSSRENRIISPLRSWLCTHAGTSLEKFQHLTEHGL